MKQDPDYYKSYYERTKRRKLELGSAWYRDQMNDPELRNRFKSMKNGYAKNRYKCDAAWVARVKLKKILQRLMRGRNTEAQCQTFIGCTKAELHLHIESQFSEGMTWENYGRSGWVVDHIIPCCKFDLNKWSDIRACFHLSNLQPMWYEQNRRKSSSCYQSI